MDGTTWGFGARAARSAGALCPFAVTGVERGRGTQREDGNVGVDGDDGCGDSSLTAAPLTAHRLRNLAKIS